MRFMYTGKDGGKDSTVWGFWPVEIKSLFSVALLCFEDGSREAYHSHAFNSVSWVLNGKLEEDVITVNKDSARTLIYGWTNRYRPSVRPVWTSRTRMHKVSSVGRTWVLTFRGPWSKTWREYLPETGEFVTLTNGRVRVE